MEKELYSREKNCLIFYLRELGGTEDWIQELPKTMAAFKDPLPPLVALDFEGIDSLHSRGLNYITHLLKEFEPKNITLCLLNCNHGPRQVLAASRLDSKLQIFLNKNSLLEFAQSQTPQTKPEPAAPPPPPPPEPETPETRVLRQQIAEVKEKLSAQEKELARFKQRHSAASLNSLLASEEKMMLGIIPLLDDLDRALQHKEQPIEALKQGLALIKNKYQAVLAKYGV